MVREMVWDRRGGDKTGSLVRWARGTVQRDPELRDAEPAHVLAYFAALLPNNTIGRHAVEHIKWGLFGYDFDSGGISWEERQARRKAADAAECERFQADVVALMATGWHREINRAVGVIRDRQLGSIAGAKADGLPWEHIKVIVPLAGLHDIDAFVERTRGNNALRDAVAHLAATLRR